MWGEGDRPGDVTGHGGRRRRQWIVAAGLVVVVAVPALLLALRSNGTPHPSARRGGPTTSSSTTTTAVPTTTTTTAAPTPVTLPPTTTTTAPPVVTGRVTRAGGAPVAHAYVIGLDDLAVATTNARGQYSLPCTGQPLMASPWLVPVTSPSGATVAGSVPGHVPGSPGPGYGFSGGTTDVSTAAPAACNGKPVNLHLPPGATVVITFLGSGGAPYSPTPGQPVDVVTLPGLSGRAAPTSPPLSAGGVQTLSQLGTGQLGILATTGQLACQGGGLVSAAATPAVVVTTVAGRTLNVKCRLMPAA